MSTAGRERLREALEPCFSERDDCIHGVWDAVTGDHFGEHLDAALAHDRPSGSGLREARLEYAEVLREAMQETAQKKLPRAAVFVTRDDAFDLLLALGRRHVGLISDRALSGSSDPEPLDTVLQNLADTPPHVLRDVLALRPDLARRLRAVISEWLEPEATR